MNFEYFIAKRIITTKVYKSSVSAPIIKIGITAIALGIIVMLIAIATGIGLQQKIRDKVIAFNGQITIATIDENNSQESGKPIRTNTAFYPEFKAIPSVSHIQAVATKFGIIRTPTTYQAILVKGVGADYNWSYFKDFLVEGRLPDYTQKRNQDVLISTTLAKTMQFKVGDKFTTVFRKPDPNQLPTLIKYNIVGIYNSGLQEFDKTYILSDLRHIQRINQWESNEVGNFEIFVDNYQNLEAIKKEVYANTNSFVTVQTVQERYASIFEWINIFDKNIYGIIAIMILVAGINMITALLVLILERTQMIGILKALGSSNWSIRKIFLYNASYIIVKGLFWGNLIGIGLLLLQKYAKLFPLNPAIYHVNEVPIYINLNYILGLNIGTFSLCLIMLLLPSYIVTKITPIQAIQLD